MNTTVYTIFHDDVLGWMVMTQYCVCDSHPETCPLHNPEGHAEMNKKLMDIAQDIPAIIPGHTRITCVYE